MYKQNDELKHIVEFIVEFLLLARKTSCCKKQHKSTSPRSFLIPVLKSATYYARYSDTGIFFVFVFLSKVKIQSGCHFGKRAKFSPLGRIPCLDTLGAENFDDINF